MANLSDNTRKQQVHNYLLEREGEWVDGPEIANERVGGSEGLKRLRELRSDLAKLGTTILMRPHPDHARDIYQYKLVMPKQPEMQPIQPLRIEGKPQIDDANRYTSIPVGLAFGEAVMCHRCHGRTKQIKSDQGLKLFQDPDQGGELCHGCNGWGIVPHAAVAS